MTSRATTPTHQAGPSGAPAPVIGLLGAECTGKSALARDLAHVLDAVLVPEYLREFVDHHGRAPRADEQAGILREQRERIRTARSAGQTVIADPMPVMTAVYSLAYFGDDSLLEDAVDEALDPASGYDLVVWCRPDFPWSPDGPQRDGPAWRALVDEILTERVLPRLRQGARVVEARGPGHERLADVGQAWRHVGHPEST